MKKMVGPRDLAIYVILSLFSSFWAPFEAKADAISSPPASPPGSRAHLEATLVAIEGGSACSSANPCGQPGVFKKGFWPSRQEILGLVSSAAGVPWKKSISVHLGDREELRFRSEQTERDFEDRSSAVRLTTVAAEVAFQLLGMDEFLPEKMKPDFVPGGTYDPFGKKLYLFDQLDDGYFVHALLHEHAHALHDQHQELSALFIDSAHDFDALMAITATVEGLAESVTYRAMQRFMGKTGAEGRFSEKIEEANASKRTPDSYRYFSYHDGLAFFQHLCARLSPIRDDFYEVVRRVWLKPPQSTRHILHPDTYLHDASREPLAPLSLEPLYQSAATKVIWESTLGELVMQAYLSDEADGTDLAAHLTRDRVAVMDQITGPLSAVVWLSEWDSETAAERMIFAAERSNISPSTLDAFPGFRIERATLRVGNRVGIATQMVPIAQNEAEDAAVRCFQELFEATVRALP